MHESTRRYIGYRADENAGKKGRQDGCGFKVEKRHGCYSRVGFRTSVT